jgi:hypothetical protein
MKTQFLDLSKRFMIAVIAVCISIPGWGQVQYSGTTNTGDVASAINFETQATGSYSFAAGYQSVASGHTSLAIGNSSTAAGAHSFAIGEFCYSGNQGFSIGQVAKANADQSYAFGKYVETNCSGSITLGSSTSNNPLVNNICNSLMIGINSSVPTLFISEAETSLNGNGIGKVGIGTTNPVARFQVADGDIFIEDINRGIIMKSPDGNCWRGTLNNNGQLEFVKLADCVLLSDERTIEPANTPGISIYPNPASKYINITCSDEDLKKFTSVSLTSIKGETVFSIPLVLNSTKLSLQNISPGPYVITLKGINTGYSQKVIVE